MFKKYETLQKLLSIDSPTGFTKNACQYIFELLQSYGYQPRYTNKGAVVCNLSTTQKPPKLALAAHTDTLGAIVTDILPDGTLAFSKIGGLLLNTFEGKYCRIHTLNNQIYNGTLLLNNPSAHVNKNAESTQRTTENMHIRVDEITECDEDTKKLGINAGDFVSFEVGYHEFENGFIKSHFLDNKISCFILFEIAKEIKNKNLDVPVELFFSNYEEVGHGGATGFSNSVSHLLVLDMAVVGEGCTGTELKCSICAKDSSGPYDYDFKKELVNLSKTHNIAHSIDVYPYYGSDGSAAWAAGNDFKVALIGPGVAASHGMERTHKLGVEATIELCMQYILYKFNF